MASEIYFPHDAKGGKKVKESYHNNSVA